MELPKTICMLPWISIETSPVGTARPCCLAREEITDNDGNKFDLNKDNLETIYHSEYMQSLRRKFRAGEKPETCKLCWDEEAADRTSKRMHSQVRLKELYKQVDWMNDDPNQLWFLDLKLGNICNLKCRICGSWSSSKWADEELKYMPKEFDKKQHIAYQWLKQGAWPRNSDTNFWDNLKQLLPNIKYLEFTGGEPFLIQEHFDLLKFAVDQGYSKNIDIHYNTNGTIDPDESWVWQHFGRVDIAFSIDNIGKRFEYERYGAKWDEVNDNISWISSYKQHDGVTLTTQLCFTVNIQNVYYLDELLLWADRKGFDNIYFNMMHNPDHMSIQKMTPAAKELVLNKLKTTFWTSDFYQKEIDSIIKFIENGTGSDGKEFLEKMQRTDAYRKQNFMDTHLEIAKAMGYD
jgi:MoaA/NifB/PqqE/SkfB family radical SAM enzyme